MEIGKETETQKIKKTALILGSTGLIGKHLVRHLVHQKVYSKIILLSRRMIEINSDCVEVKIIDFSKIGEEVSGIGVDDFFCCIGTTIKKAKTKQRFKEIDYKYPLICAQTLATNGMKRIFLVSSAGANPNAKSFYLKTKGELERDLERIPGIHLQSFRPSVLEGDRDEIRILEELAIKLGKVLIAPIPYFKKYAPIKGESVAMAMVSRSKEQINSHNIFELNQILKVIK